MLSPLKIAFWLDVCLLIAVCALEQIQFTGAILHEWLGLTFGAMMIVHLLFSWPWIASQSRKLFESSRSFVNYLLNLSLFASIIAMIFSGVLISQEAIPAFTGKRAAIPIDSPWFAIHNNVSNLVPVLAGLHLALNWQWAAAAGRKLAGRFRVGAR